MGGVGQARQPVGATKRRVLLAGNRCLSAVESWLEVIVLALMCAILVLLVYVLW
jgi:hypothetical protein